MELLKKVKGNQIMINKHLYLEAITDPENKFSLDIWLAERFTGQKLYLSSIAEKEFSGEKIQALMTDALQVWNRYENRKMTA